MLNSEVTHETRQSAPMRSHANCRCWKNVRPASVPIKTKKTKNLNRIRSKWSYSLKQKMSNITNDSERIDHRADDKIRQCQIKHEHVCGWVQVFVDDYGCHDDQVSLFERVFHKIRNWKVRLIDFRVGKFRRFLPKKPRKAPNVFSNTYGK